MNESEFTFKTIYQKGGNMQYWCTHITSGFKMFAAVRANCPKEDLKFFRGSMMREITRRLNAISRSIK